MYRKTTLCSAKPGQPATANPLTLYYPPLTIASIFDSYLLSIEAVVCVFMCTRHLLLPRLKLLLEFNGATDLFKHLG